MIKKQNLDLYSTSDLKLLEINSNALKHGYGSVDDLVSMIERHGNLYPNIKNWLIDKVIPGIQNEKRLAYVCYCNKRPVATSVLKLGEKAKFCHLYINNKFREINLGDIFFSLMSLKVMREAKTVHFTLPKSLWEEKEGFFRSFGFSRAVLSDRQYRDGLDELVCAANIDAVLPCALNKIKNIFEDFSDEQGNIFKGIVLSVRPEYFDKISQGEKTVELRRRFSDKWIGKKATLYVSQGVGSILGYAYITNAEQAKVKDVWQKYNSRIGCGFREYQQYTRGVERIWAIELGYFEPLYNAISVESISRLIGHKLNPPQSYLSLANNDKWSLAIAVAELLHGRFKVYHSTFQGSRLKEKPISDIRKHGLVLADRGASCQPSLFSM